MAGNLKMAYKQKLKQGRPRQDVKYRTIRNFKALKGFEFQEIKGKKIYFKKKEDEKTQ
jgi:hypothetical protein